MKAVSPKIRYPELEKDCVLIRGVNERLEEIREDEIAFIEPCAAETGKYTAKITLSDERIGKQKLFFDKSMLCELLDVYKGRFAEFECSETLGIARIKWKGKGLSLFTSGSIKISTAFSENDIMQMLHDITRLVWGTMICSVCGKPAIHCASGTCSKCLIPHSDGSKEAQIDSRFSGVFLTNALNSMDQAIRALEVIYGKFLHGLIKQEKSDISFRIIDKKVLKASQLGLEYILRVPSSEDALLGFAVLGSSWNLRAALEAFRRVHDKNGTLKGLMKEIDEDVKGQLVSLLKEMNEVLSMLSVSFMTFGKESRERLEEKIKVIVEGSKTFQEMLVKLSKRQEVLDALIDFINLFLVFGRHLSGIIGG